MKAYLRLSFVSAAALASCTSDNLTAQPPGGPPGVHLDAGFLADARAIDARPAPDASPPDVGEEPPDSGDLDTGVIEPADTGVRDASDSGIRDAAHDAGAPDALVPDTGIRDAAAADAAPPDSGALIDAGPADAGCVCPPLPTACRPTPPNVPAFSPDTDAPKTQLFEVMACANTSLHVAIYDVSWSCISDALSQRLAQNSTITVEIVVDDSTCPLVNGTRGCVLSQIQNNPRVSIVDDQRSRLMHDKFVVADGQRVWVSSANFTANSFCTDHNNAIVVDQGAIVSAYETEFERMFVLGMFGPRPRQGPATGGGDAVYFSPETPETSPSTWFNDMVARIGTATTSVEIMIDAFTRTEISDALIAAQGRGVMVRGVISVDYVSQPPVQALVAANVPLKKGVVHDKVMIIDHHLVITGSTNWSADAWANDENSLWIDDLAVARSYGDELARVFAVDPPL